MFEIEVEITWRMLQTRVSQACYVDILICSDGSVNSMFGFARINEINMLKLYLNSRSRRENSSSIELTWFLSNSQRTTQTLRTNDPSRLYGNDNRQVSVLEIVNIEPQLGMTSASYCYGESSIYYRCINFFCHFKVNYLVSIDYLR